MTDEQFMALMDLIRAIARAEAAKSGHDRDYYNDCADVVADRIKPLFVRDE